MLAHDWLDSLRGLVRIVERYRRDVVVKDVSLNNAVEKSTANETELTIDRGGSTTDVVPSVCIVVRKSGIGVLEERDGDY